MYYMTRSLYRATVAKDVARYNSRIYHFYCVVDKNILLNKKKYKIIIQ